jgi:hypothetical protein
MLGIIAVLLVAVFAVGLRGTIGNFLHSANVFASVTDSHASAEIIETEQPSKDDLVHDLAKKVAVYLKNSKEEVAPAAVVATTTTELPPAPDEADKNVEQRCAAYAPAGALWDPRGVRIEEAEGARIVYRDAPAQASSTDMMNTRDVLLQLPLRSFSQGMQHCIPSDVIGITEGGSLIRNTDVGTYRVFGASMLIGYALDGYPIYGTTAAKTDVCGGVTEGGQYRYHLSGDRKTIINCFAGSPATL